MNRTFMRVLRNVQNVKEEIYKFSYTFILWALNTFCSGYGMSLIKFIKEFMVYYDRFVFFCGL
jgi:hypothetical protein